MALLITVLATVPANNAPAAAIEGGSTPTDNTTTRATVRVRAGGGSCTGALVRPDLVLSAGHCVTARGSDLGHAPFNRDRRAWNDAQRPDRFYDLLAQYPRGVAIDVGPTSGAPLFRGKAVEYAIPGNADMILLRLETPVPSRIAQPVPVLTSLPGRSSQDPSGWVRGRQFIAAGFGTSAIGGPLTSTLREATVTGAVYPCPRNGGGWVFGGDHKLCVNRGSGIGRPGDSGGPLYWTDDSGRRWLAAVYQGVEGARGGRYTATFYRGGANFNNVQNAPLANIGAWLEGHIDGDTGYVAYLWSSQTEDHFAPTTYAMNPAGIDPYVTKDAVGVYHAHFPGLRALESDTPRVVSVTSYGNTATACKLGNDVRSDRVEVRCYGSAGVPADARFAILSTDLNGDYAGVVNARGTEIESHRPLAVEKTGSGVYRVTLNDRRATQPWKFVSATAMGGDATLCNVRSWQAASATIVCRDADGRATDSAFHFSATSATDQSYAWSSRLTGTGNTPANFSNVVGGGDATIERTAMGRYRVRFAGLPARSGGNVQVNAYGNVDAFCKVGGWSATTANVRCYDGDGEDKDARFVVRYVDPLDAGMRITADLFWLRALSSELCGSGLDFTGSLRFTSGVAGSNTVASFPERTNTVLRTFSTNPRITGLSVPGQRFVMAKLSVTDVDGGFCGSDDIVDLAPGETVNDLTLRIDLQRHRLEVLDPKASIESRFGVLTSNGRHARERARVSLGVNVQRPFIVR